MALYRLNAEERRLIDLALHENVDYLTDYYLRGPNSGTWWLPGAESDRWKKGYERLLAIWEGEGRPDRFDYVGHSYRTVWEHEKSKAFPSLPAFHHNHGLLMLPWQKQLHNDRHPIITVTGGYGSSKTVGAALSDLVHAVTLPGYRSLVLAPNSVQVMEVYTIMQRLMEGTLYQERFLINASQRPFPKITIGHEGVGENTIEFYPILNNYEKLLTLTADRAIIDQAERLDDIKEIIRMVGTRFRGRVPLTGRERLGTITLLANSADNQQYWDVVDMAEADPENYAAYTVSSYDNIYLTDKDIKRFELQVGKDEESIRVYLKGGRPRGNGKEFSRDVLERVEDASLDRIMDDHAGEPGYILMRRQGVGVYEWMLPPLDDRTYLVISDPGTSNPPERNSPPIFVWDITDFPDKPMTLAAFVWVFGNGDIMNWATRYAELVHKYKAIGRCAFDATGYQAGYDTWMAILEDLMVEKINLSGNMKALCLNAAKMICSKGLMKLPKALDNVFSQLSRYDYSEDKPQSKLRQDLVMAFIMSAWWSQRLWYWDDGEFEERPGYDPRDRSYRPQGDRYGTHAR